MSASGRNTTSSSRASSISTARFFSQVSTRNAPLPRDIYFPELVEDKLPFDNDFLMTAKMVRDRCIHDAQYANAIRWQPAFKQLIYRNDEGQLIVTISQNSIGNAITELLGVVVKRIPDADAYGRDEPALIEQAPGSTPAPGGGRPRRRHRHPLLGSRLAPWPAGLLTGPPRGWPAPPAPGLPPPDGAAPGAAPGSARHRRRAGRARPVGQQPAGTSARWRRAWR